MTFLEEAAEIDDQQVVSGALRPLNELARLPGAELPEAWLSRERVSFGELRMRRKREDVGTPLRRDREVADRARLAPDPVAP